MLESIPHPLTRGNLEALVQSEQIETAEPVVLATRYEHGETTSVAPAVVMQLQGESYGLVENENRTGYELLCKGPREEVWDHVEEWCDSHGYQKQM